MQQHNRARDAEVVFFKLRLANCETVLFSRSSHTSGGPVTAGLLWANQNGANTINSTCLHMQLLAFLFPQARLIFSITASAIGVKNHFMYTMRVLPKQIPMPSLTSRNNHFGACVLVFPRWESSPCGRTPHRGSNLRDISVIWGMLSAHFMDIYVPVHWRLCYF